MKYKNRFLISLIFIIISVVLTFFAINDGKKINKSYLQLSSDNSNLKEKLDDSQKTQKSLDEEINSKKSKIEGIDNESNKFGVMSAKKDEIMRMKEELLNTHMAFQNNNFDFYYSHNNSNNALTPLNGIFFDEALKNEDRIDNLIVLPIIINSYTNEYLNYEISRNNFKVIENLGILDYVENGDNYLVKSILLNDSSNSDILKKRNSYLILLNSRYLNAYRNIYEEVTSSQIFINNSKDYLNHNLKDSTIPIEEKDKKKIDVLNAFCIDLLNSSSNQLNDFSITESNGFKQFKRNDFVLMTEKVDDKLINVNFFNEECGSIYEVNDKMD